MKTRLDFYILICYSIFFLIGISSCSPIKKERTEADKEHDLALQYHIKRITEYKTPFLISTAQTEYISIISEFNKEGYKVQETNYYSSDPQNKVISFHSYDSGGNLIQSKAINSDSSFVYKQTINYTDKKLQNELYFYLPDGSYKYRNVASYDQFGRMTELKWYWPDGLKAINKFSYRGDKKTEDTEYAPDGKFRYKWTYDYDSKGAMTKAVQFYPNNTINSKIIYQYNTKGQLAVLTNFFGESIQNSFTFDYDHKDLLLKKTEYNASGITNTVFRYEYQYY